MIPARSFADRFFVYSYSIRRYHASNSCFVTILRHVGIEINDLLLEGIPRIGVSLKITRVFQYQIIFSIKIKLTSIHFNIRISSLPTKIKLDLIFYLRPKTKNILLDNSNRIATYYLQIIHFGLIPARVVQHEIDTKTSCDHDIAE